MKWKENQTHNSKYKWNNDFFEKITMFVGKLTKREETYICKSRNEKGVVLLISVNLTYKLELSERRDLNGEISSIGPSFKAFS